MENSSVLELLEKYKLGTCSTEEISRLESWYTELAEGKELEIIDEHGKGGIQLTNEMWLEFKGKIIKEEMPVVKKLWWPRFAKAAVAFIALSSGLYFYANRSSNSINKETNLATDIRPGDNKAILTLSDGSKITLDHAANGKLATQLGIKIVKLADGKLLYSTTDDESNLNSKNILYNTISTPNGGQYQIVLPDGTKVWLNAASSLRYPTYFAGSNREVTLVGEGYFEVTKNETMPFKVKTGTQEVTVLGTHFNINGYTDEPSVKTTLLEGSVKVSQANYSVLIKPGQQAQTTADYRNKVIDTDVKEAVAWKNGLFSFKRADIKTIMRQVSRWYNVEVEYSGQIPDSKFTGKIYRNVNLSQVLESIGYLGLNFNIEGRKIIITIKS